MKKSSAMTVYVILLTVIFIDSIGLGMIFPILAPLFMQSNSHLFTVATSNEARYILYGVTLASYPAAMFFGAALLGEASDRYGRKPVLLVSLLGNVGGLIISAIGISLHSVTLLIIGRLISGVTAGSFPIAQAAIIDGCPFEEKAGRISMACGASAIGWMIGPVIGGVFSNENLLPQFSPALPFYIVAIICLLTAFLLSVFLHKTPGHGRKESGSLLLSGLKNIIETFKSAKTQLIMVTLTCFLFGYLGFLNYLAVYAIKVYHFDKLTNTVFLTLFAVWFAITMIFIVPRISKRQRLELICFIAMIMQLIPIFLMLVWHNPWVGWIALPFIAIGVSAAYVLLVTILSNRTDESQQGRIMGVTASMMSLVWTIAPTISGLLQTINVFVPLVFSCVILALATLLTAKFSVIGFD